MHLWMMVVTGFDASKHCLPCLKGRRVPIAKTDGDFLLEGVEPGDLVYLCGVSRKFVWGENFHLPARFTGHLCDSAVGAGFKGGTAELVGFEPVSFDDKAARRLFPDRDASYLTCRNFQFGAQFFGS